MIESSTYPPITLITGTRESGRTTYAVLVCADFYKQGMPCFHNSTAFFGWNIQEYTDAFDGLRTLAEKIPERSIILIEEADAQKMTRRSCEPSHEPLIVTALATLAEKSCHLLLTTVQGNEGLIAKPLLENAYEHVTSYMEAESRESFVLATMHRGGRFLVPVGQNWHDPESVQSAMLLANTFKEMRRGAPEGKAVEFTEDRLFEVPQPSLSEMKYPKYPEYPIYYRHRIMRTMPDGRIHRLSQDAILHFSWLESVIEHPNETVALEIMERSMPQWGFEYQSRPIAQDSNFPDGQAIINGELTNLEVVSIQPRYPGGHSLHDLVALTQVGRAEKLGDTAVLKCQTCRTREPFVGVTSRELPDHDKSHRWILYVPSLAFGPDFPFDLAATPLLDIRREDFITELEKAVRSKSDIFASQSKGLRNWVIVLAQGFPVDASWFNEIHCQWRESVDGVCVVATEGYVGAHNQLEPFKDYTTILLKCPAEAQDHNCYHPGYSYRVSDMDTDFQPLSRDGHSIEKVSEAAWNYPLPAIPVKKTLTLRDQDEKEIQTFWSANVTDSQVKELLKSTGYSWSEQPCGSFIICSLSDVASQGGCRAEVRRLGNGTFVGSIDYRGYQIEEDFLTVEEGKSWCEFHTAMLLLHLVE